MKIVLTGATGFIGKALVRRLYTAGHQLTILTRETEAAREALPYPLDFHRWRPAQEPPPAEPLRGADAFVNLAGENIAGKRWNPVQKRKIRDSRVIATTTLKEAIRLDPEINPAVFISASAIGFYGDRGDSVLTEQDPRGEGFLAEVCGEWEQALMLRETAGTRRIAVRLGIVLGAGGGALAKLLPLFRAGLGGPAGSGRQWMSWIHMEDVAELFVFLLEHPEAEGVFNAVAPNPARNRDFSQALASVLRRPALLPAPKPALRLVLGEMAALVLDSQRVEPAAALRAGFRFRHEQPREALERVWEEVRKKR